MKLLEDTKNGGQAPPDKNRKGTWANYGLYFKLKLGFVLSLFVILFETIQQHNISESTNKQQLSQVNHRLGARFHFKSHLPLHSAKGGAVETGCIDLYDVIY